MNKLKVKELADTLNQLCNEGKGNSRVYIREQDVRIQSNCVNLLRSFLEFDHAPWTGITDVRKFLDLIKRTRDYLEDFDEESKYDEVYISDRYFESIDTIYDDESLILDFDVNTFIGVIRKR